MTCQKELRSPGKRNNLSQSDTPEHMVRVCSTDPSSAAGSTSFGSVSCSHLAAVQPGKPRRLIESAKYCVTNSLFNSLHPILSSVKIQMCIFYLLPGTAFLFHPIENIRFAQYLASFQYLPRIILPFLIVLRTRSRTGNVFMSWCIYMDFCIYYVNNDSQVLLAELYGDSSQYVTQ